MFDREQQAADAFYRLYRRVRLRANVSRSAPLSLEGAIERQALLIYATEDSGVLTPRLRAVLRVGPDAAVIATDHLDGRTLGRPRQGRSPTSSCARSGTPCCSCTSTGSRTGR